MMDVQITPQTYSVVNSYPSRYQRQFEKLVLHLSRKDILNQYHALANGLFIFKSEELRAIGRIYKKAFLLELIFFRSDFPRLPKDFTQQIIQTHEVRKIKRNGETFLENPPRKLKRPRLKPGWRETLNNLFPDNKELLKYLVPFILKEGAKGFISLFSFLAR